MHTHASIYTHTYKHTNICTHTHTYIYIDRYIYGHGDTSSNPGRDWLHFT